MTPVHVYVSFDVDHDGDLYDQLVSQSRTPLSGFNILGGSGREASVDPDRRRTQIRDADQVVVICGAHTAAATAVSDELEIAREVNTPYLLLWGRREVMCTKPSVARSGEGMYSWTLRSLQDHIAESVRRSRVESQRSATLARR